MEQHNPPPPLLQRRMMGEYYKRFDTNQVSLGFRPTNSVNFDINSIVLLGLRENKFDGRENKDPWDHLSRFSEICQIRI
ncbi:hypothetical protein TSUD_59750 [Trifolium subterraneum]|uniref:Uncharacterized protein n=1 Tax=Trifolium subterraneum TaxID=3900 RepID=A0A2Z6P5N3_TRISU|nr:hypothetical protein TSUD_59750 [Trifolium subterraneum]